VEWLAIATVQDKNLMNFLRNVRLTVQLKIELEGVVACVHCADVFVADVESEDLRKRITELSRTDPNYLETAERRGWVKNRSAIVTIGESAWATIRIQQRYDIVQDKVVAEDQQVFLDEPIQKTPFNGFSWPKVN
jgi:regulation of enolase protein 1 (concanavalin A-like superfamily)